MNFHHRIKITIFGDYKQNSPHKNENLLSDYTFNFLQYIIHTSKQHRLYRRTKTSENNNSISNKKQK